MHALGEHVQHNRPRRVLLDGSATYSRPKMVQVGPVTMPPPILKAFQQQQQDGVVFETLKPLIYLLRGIGLFPIAKRTPPGVFSVSVPLFLYSVAVLLTVAGYVGYIKWDKVEIVKTAEGKFEDAVIDYLFSVYLLPVVFIPIALYEAKKVAKVYNEWSLFEDIYKRTTGKKLPLFLGNKPLVVSIAIPLLSCGSMVVTHVTMVHFRILQVIPYCFINTVTYMIGGIWYMQSDVIGKIAITIADDFERALKNIGPSSMVADYRSLWMLLSRVVREVSNAMCYVVTFLCLYLFLIITLTVYGLLSKLQEGFGTKDIGLAVTAVFAVALLYFICDEAHYASNSVRVYFQKKLLLVELSWMNEDAQQEINMFLRATEMNATEMNLGGFFNVNRTLFKSLLATMVTYLVVLLQFQISIPEDTTSMPNMTTTKTNTTTMATTAQN